LFAPLCCTSLFAPLCLHHFVCTTLFAPLCLHHFAAWKTSFSEVVVGTMLYRSSFQGLTKNVFSENSP
jgi:hypothetical protein